MSLRLLLAAVLLCFAAAATAQEHVVWQGGISEEERAQAPESGTRLVFFVSTGSFLSNIALQITASDGNEVVNITTEGPWVYLDLPSGSYDVQAVRGNGDAQSLKIAIDDSDSQEFAFMFPGS